MIWQIKNEYVYPSFFIYNLVQKPENKTLQIDYELQISLLEVEILFELVSLLFWRFEDTIIGFRDGLS